MAVRKICFVAGYSAGHILPCIDLYKKKYHDAKIVFFATTKKLDQKILTKEPSFTNIFLHLPRISHMNITGYALLFLQFIIATIKSFYTLCKNKPERVVTTGSFIALPVCYAARLLRIPIDIYELNAHPGKTNKHIAPFATNIFTCFKRAQQQLAPLPTTLVNYPQTVYPVTTQKNVTTKPIVLVLGGSQGSTSLNTIICNTLTHHPALHKKIDWIHQTGSQEYSKVAQWYKDQNIKSTIFSFADNLNHYLQRADLIICRAGAGTLFSIVAQKKTCITIPLRNVAENHQLLNAQELKKEFNQFITIIEQKDLAQNNDILYEHIIQYLPIKPK